MVCFRLVLQVVHLNAGVLHGLASFNLPLSSTLIGWCTLDLIAGQQQYISTIGTETVAREPP